MTSPLSDISPKRSVRELTGHDVGALQAAPEGEEVPRLVAAHRRVGEPGDGRGLRLHERQVDGRTRQSGPPPTGQGARTTWR